MSQYFRTEGGLPGRYGAHVAGILGEKSGQEAITADLARDFADLTDAARLEQDPRLFIAASRAMSQALGKLGFDIGGGGQGDDGSEGWMPVGLARALGSAAPVRDEEESGSGDTG